jgi:chaperone modulatory protein CbpM
MVTMQEVLERLDGVPDRVAVEEYITRTWVRPIQEEQVWYFEEIDIARIQLVHHLRYELLINDDAMDIVLQLLDQVYGLREQMRQIKHALDVVNGKQLEKCD